MSHLAVCSMCGGDCVAFNGAGEGKTGVEANEGFGWVGSVVPTSASA